MVRGSVQQCCLECQRGHPLKVPIKTKVPPTGFASPVVSSSVEPATGTRTARPRLGCFLLLFCSVTHLVLAGVSNCRPISRRPCPLYGPRKPSVPQHVHLVRLPVLWLVPIRSRPPTLVGSRCGQNR